MRGGREGHVPAVHVSHVSHVAAEGGGHLLDEAGVRGGVELERGAVGVGEVAQRAADHLLLLGVEVLEDVVPVIIIIIIIIKYS